MLTITVIPKETNCKCIYTFMPNQLFRNSTSHDGNPILVNGDTGIAEWQVESKRRVVCGAIADRARQIEHSTEKNKGRKAIAHSLE
jgi:hypothetical protein